jgi:WD40 repeat protein
LSPNGKYAAAGSRNGKLVIFDLIKGTVEEIFGNEHTTRIAGCSWSKRGGSRVATIDSLGSLFIWE